MPLSATVPSVRGFEDIDRFTVLPIDRIGWPEEYPYAPKTTLRIAHTSDRLLLRYEVTGEDIKAICMEDNGKVWEDSCVEFFVQKAPGDEHYYNFETNCIGTGLAARRLSRDICTHFDASRMSRVIRRSSLPHEPVEKENASWSLELEVPFELIGLNGCPERLKANFYKCGARPHFLSWSPVVSPKPNFHCPEFFGELILEP